MKPRIHGCVWILTHVRFDSPHCLVFEDNFFWNTILYNECLWCYVSGWRTKNGKTEKREEEKEKVEKKERKKMNKKTTKQEPRGSKDATTLSSLIVHFLLFFVFDGRTHRRTDILMSFLNCPWLSLGACQISSSSEHRKGRFSSFENNTGQTDGPTFWCHFWIVLDCLLVHVKFRRHRNIGKDVFRRSKIKRDRRTDGRTNGRTDGRTDGYDLL